MLRFRFAFAGVATSVVVLFAVLLPKACARHVADEKYYKLLGVRVTASDAVIKKAYRQLALKWHPDKQQQKSDAEKKDAENKFKEISLAYDTLSDHEKRKVYDQVGEDGMKRGDKGHNFRAGHFDPFKIFEQVFRGFGGGGGFSFNINLGANTGRLEGLFADHPEAIETLNDEGKLQKLIQNAAAGTDAESKQLVAILCIATNGDCKRLKPGFVKLGKSYKGVANFYAMDCMSKPMLCRVVDPDVKRYPAVVYFGYGKRRPLGMTAENDAPFPPGEKITIHSIRTWLAKVIPESVVHITSTSTWEHFLRAELGKAKIALLTEKGGTPPRLKPLSMIYRESLSVALVSKKVVPELFDSHVMLGASNRVPKTLPIFYNVQRKDFAERSGEQLPEYLAEVVRAFQMQELESRAQIEELTWDMYASGDVCSATDHRFCLLVVFPTRAELDIEKRMRTFWAVGEEFKKERADPVRVHYIVSNEAANVQKQLRMKLSKLLAAAGFSDSNSTGVLMWRPKWKRFDKFDGNTTCREDIINFVRSTFVNVALDSIDGFSQRHAEL